MSLTVGERAKLIRESKGIKMSFVSRKIGYKTTNGLSEFEKGNRRLDPDMFPVLAEALGVEISDLFSDQKDRELRTKQMA